MTQSTPANVFSRDLIVVKPAHVTAGQLPKYLERASTRYDFLQSAAKTGIATDGRMAFRMTRKDIASVKTASECRAGGKTVTKEMAEGVLQKNPKTGYSDAIVIGAQISHEALSGRRVPDLYLLENTRSGRPTVVDAKFVRMIQARYPHAIMQVANRKASTTPVLFFDGGEIVGAIMPFVCEVKHLLLQGEPVSP